MPKRTDIRKVLMIGSGPIVVGQACEFDYSGSQACKALREEGYEVVLVNSNPATIMTDTVMADRTYIEPITAEAIEKIIARERPDAIIPTLGGQTGLNVAVFLARQGVYERYGVEVLGADPEAITRAEDRDEFKKAMQEIGVKTPASGIATSVEEGMRIGLSIGFPLILRPAFTLGGTGGATVYNREELESYLHKALDISPVHQVLVEQSVIGWKEIEFEVMRDCVDNVIAITSMENVDPMGVHTGDSVVVAPSQTLSAPEYAEYVRLSKKIIRKIGITGGGANIQFAGNPETGEIVIIEVNPRLSRSSALASKATGFPIARIATKLAVGYTLEEILNSVTGCSRSYFEPTVDYCVFKISRFTFEKFPTAERVINTSMKSVGEAMAIGRTFKEALQKGIRSLEIGRFGLGDDGKDPPPAQRRDLDLIRQKLRIPNDERFFYIRYAYEAGLTTEEIHSLSHIDPWFLENIRELGERAKQIHRYAGHPEELPPEVLRKAKADGFSDRQLAHLLKVREAEIYDLRHRLGIRPVFKLVDTCAGELDAAKPYFYSTYEQHDENRVTDNPKKVIVLSGGPNRIGQGIEFDYCCSHAVFALKEMGYEAIIINSNPETVSTDYDTSDKLYFEPLTREDVLEIVQAEKPEGVIVQLGGQTPLNLAVPLEQAGVRILGTSPDAIDRAEDRERFKQLVEKLGLTQPANGTAFSFEGARKVAAEIGYPVVVRPSYVLGGRAMEIVYDDEELREFMGKAAEASPERPILIDKFLEDAIEVDVDCVADGTDVVLGGIMEHIEMAGVHSGDSACCLPPFSLTEAQMEQIRAQTVAMALELGVKGLMNVQYAIKNNVLYVLEVNPRASRTVPYVSKVTGVPLAKVATQVMCGRTLKEIGFTKEVTFDHVGVKEAVFPFSRFPGVDAVLGPEMKSTGEVMGIDADFGVAYAKSQMAAGSALPTSGAVLFSLKNMDKRPALFLVKRMADLGFKILATEGTAHFLRGQGIEVEIAHKVSSGIRPNILDQIRNHQIQLIVNTPSGKHPRQDEVAIRSTAVLYGVPLITTLQGASAAVVGIEQLVKKGLAVKTIQEYHSEVRGRPSLV
ncbi:MAG: carbamoyl-phosphate synthase large subunit [Sphingomonadaceae bacterium]